MSLVTIGWHEKPVSWLMCFRSALALKFMGGRPKPEQDGAFQPFRLVVMSRCAVTMMPPALHLLMGKALRVVLAMPDFTGAWRLLQRGRLPISFLAFSFSQLSIWRLANKFCQR